jgi:hypothetical protein
MNYLILTIAMMWFPVNQINYCPIKTDWCLLSVVSCETEQSYIQDYIRERLGDKGVAIAHCESRFKLDAYNINRNGSNDAGVWQINSIHGLSDDCRFDLKCSTDWVIEKVKRDKGWSAWTCNKIIKSYPQVAY